MTKMKKIKLRIIALMSMFALSSLTFADAKGIEKALEILEAAKNSDSGWGDAQAEGTMIFKNREGKAATSRQMRIKILEGTNDVQGDKTLIIFSSPAAVTGTAFLSHTRILDSSNQWLYLPALKKIKRIRPQDRSSPFMGSQISLEDLVSFEINNYSHEYIGDEVVNGEDCFVVQQVPRYLYSGYKRRVIWIDKKQYRTQKIDFYDRGDALKKTLNFSDYERYKARFWRASKLEMIDHQNSNVTVLTLSNYQFNSGLGDRDFDLNTLKREVALRSMSSDSVAPPPQKIQGMMLASSLEQAVQPATQNAYSVLVKSGTEMVKEKRYFSKNGQYFVIWQGDGNIALYKADGGWVKSFNNLLYEFNPNTFSQSTAPPIGKIIVQKDGNLCLYNKQGDFLWGSMQDKYSKITPGDPVAANADLVVTNDAKLQIRKGDQVFWEY